MSWGMPNIHWVEGKKIEHLPDSGCHACYVFEKIFSGDQGTFILQHHSPDFRCGCHNYPGLTRVTHHDLAVNCEPHAAMLDYIMRLYRQWSEQMISSGVYDRIHSPYGVQLNLSEAGVPTITVLDHLCNGRKSYEFVLRKPPSFNTSPQETTIDTSWIDLGLATMWKDRCINQQQSPRCREQDGSVLVAPNWLIDTRENRLVRGEATMEYVSLSYRWGTSVWPRVGLDKLKALQKPGGLSDSFIAEMPIIRDAIHIVKSINERYLWADTVCIIHDHKTHLASELQNMGSIYASAKLAIIATDGDGMAGIPGLQGCSAPRTLDGIFPWTDNREIFVRNLPSISHLFAAEYFKRGWTFQEFILSPRRLVIGNQQIQWTCGCGTWHEDLPHQCSPIDENNDDVLQLSKILRRWPDFNALGSVLRSYNHLEMTYPEDALPGITGLLKIISPSFAGGFLFGLPVMCFESALLWGSRFWYHNLVGAEYKGLERRQQSARTQSLLPNAELPSWSWVGWKSDYLSILKDEEDYEVITYSNTSQRSSTRLEKWITKPTTRWYSQDAPTSTVKRQIKSSWFKRCNTSVAPHNLPDGWTMEAYPGVNGPDPANARSLPFGISGKYVFRHPEFPDRLFWRPFPVSTDRAVKQMKQAKFLSCVTKRAFFPCIRRIGCTLEAGGMDFHLQVLTENGDVCGWIQLPHANAQLPSFYTDTSPVPSLDMKSEPDASSDSWSDNSSSDSLGRDYQVIELVVVCQRSFSDSFNYNRFLWLEKRAYRVFYGVLCIGWENGVAYRKGYGYVIKKNWDQQHGVEDVNLVLG